MESTPNAGLRASFLDVFVVGLLFFSIFWTATRGPGQNRDACWVNSGIITMLVTTVVLASTTRGDQANIRLKVRPQERNGVITRVRVEAGRR